MDAAATRPSRRALEALASLLAYPDAGFPARARAAAAEASSAVPAAAEDLAAFRAWAESTPFHAQEESYARTFDWSPTRCLEIGWHLHGETYDRGAFLVAMRDLLRRADVAEGGDLPDHLRLVLSAVARLPEEETAEMVATSLVPALAKVVQGFGDEANPYRGLVRAVATAVQAVAGAGEGRVEARPCGER